MYLRLLASTLLIGTLGAATGAPAAIISVATTPTPIHEVAVSGDRAGWITGPYETAPCLAAVRRVTSDRLPVAIANTCRNEDSSLHALALAGARALYIGRGEYLEEGATPGFGARLVTIGGGSRWLTSAYGERHVRADGNGSAIVYAFTRMETDPATADCEQSASPLPCHLIPKGRVYLVEKGEVRRIRIGAPVQIALSGHRLAAVRAGDIWTSEETVEPTAEGHVEIYDVRERALVRRVVGGDVRSIAFDHGLLAMLAVDDAGRWSIERYDVATDRSVYKRSVPSTVGRTIAAGAGWIVYSVGSEIRRLNAAGESERVWKGRRAPADLEVDGRRVVWAVNTVDDRGHVLSATLPGGYE